ncbi:MAG: hypothetical protein QOK15_211 [Nocardioidaceae bacterium]|nr:hypothetical protein [Nocardioidaceae bacterium]
MRRALGPLLVAPLMASLVGVVAAENQSPAVASTAGVGRASVTASADAYTRRHAPRANTGKAFRWTTGGGAGTKRRAYLKFVVPAPAAGTVISTAHLSAHVEGRTAARGRGPAVFRTDNHWRERTLTWRNQPALGARVANSVERYAADRWATWDVTPALTPAERAHGGVVSFALATGKHRRLRFGSRESGKPPRISIATTQLTPPTAPLTGVTTAATALNWGPVVAGDEFNYSGAPSSTKWSVYDSAGQSGHGRRSPSAWSLDGHVATVTGDSNGTTGGMSAKFAHRKYGRWEVRMRTNARDPEYHPVLMLWPDSTASTCPEIDFAEGSTDTRLISFYEHYGCGGVQTWGRHTIDTTQWHNYAVEWTPTAVTGYVDGVQWFRDANPAHEPPGSMHQTIQLDWFPDGTTTTKSWMQLDWVRVYNLT